VKKKKIFWFIYPWLFLSSLLLIISLVFVFRLKIWHLVQNPQNLTEQFPLDFDFTLLSITFLWIFFITFFSLWISRKISVILSQANQLLELWPLETAIEQKNMFQEGQDFLKNTAKNLNTIKSQLTNLTNQKDLKEMLLSKIREGVMIIDHDWKVVQYNQPILKFFGQKKLSGPLHDVQDQQVHTFVRQNEILSVLKEAMSHQITIEKEMSTDKDVTFQMQVTPLTLPPRNLPGLFVMINDVSHLRKLENLRREFASNVSHELKTPLTVIQGYTETLLEDQKIGQQEKSFLEKILFQTNRLREIIENLMHLSALERTVPRVQMSLESDVVLEPLGIELQPLSPLIEAAINLASLASAKKKIIIEWKNGLQSRNELQARVNGPLIQQAFFNLIENAVKYSPVNSQIEIECKKYDDGMVFKVRDQGPGIPPEHHDRLFERFYCVDKARSKELGGSGLGLSIVKHIGQIHRAQVYFECPKEGGSIFFIKLPLS
jgi:two-component system phosphate regulon sensor histidine kinase PhoR